MNIFGCPIKTMKPEDWEREHYDCPVLDKTSCDDNIIMRFKYCVRHHETMMIECVEK
jgi:hypothetical protein